jgi:radical SAM protein with 4Fe4S-binding SPASM domain
MNTHGLLLQWHVTERCNLRCAHCYQEGYASEEFSLAELLGVLDQFKELLARRRGELRGLPYRGHVTVTGGEPFLRDDFLALVKCLAAEKGRLTFAILTNGSMINEAMANRLAELGPSFVQVSIDGTERTNDSLRAQGAFVQAVSALKHLVRVRVPAVISFTAQRCNYREFAEVARLGCELGVDRVWADRLIPWGAAATLREQLLSIAETREFFHIMDDARAEAERRFGRTKVILSRALQFLVGGGRPYHCAAGDGLIALLPNGDLLPCRRMPIVVGNVRDRSLSDLYYENGVLKRLRDHDRPSRGCEGCKHALQCGGGLRCLSYALTGDPLTADPGCWHADRSSIQRDAALAVRGADCHAVPDVIKDTWAP